MAKKIRGMYKFLQVVKGNLGVESDPKLSIAEINEILEILLDRRQFELYEKVIGYAYGRELDEEEGMKILKLVKGYNYKPSLARRMARMFPNNKEWSYYLIYNSLKNHQNVDVHQDALWLASKPDASKEAKRAALAFLVNRGRISEAKIFKMRLGEEFTNDEIKTMYRYMSRNDMVYELHELFNLPGLMPIQMVKSFVYKYNNAFVQDDEV